MPVRWRAQKSRPDAGFFVVVSAPERAVSPGWILV
jgi:hypothetical protein